MMHNRFRSFPLCFTVRKRIFSEKEEKLHSHDFPQLWYCSEGEYVHYIEDVPYVCRAGSLVIVPAGVSHAFYVEDTATITCLEGMYWFFKQLEGKPFYENLMHFVFLPKLINPKPLFRFNLLGKERRFAENTLERLSSFDYERSISKNELQIIYDGLLSLFALPRFSITEKQLKSVHNIILTQLDPIMSAIKYMNENYMNKIHINDLLRVSALNQTTFYQLMKKTFGVTYALYTQKIRITHVRDLITFGTFSFDYIADCCGFESITYMNRIFKKYYGITLSRERSFQRDSIREFPNMVMTQDYFQNGVFPRASQKEGR